ncbi:phosphate import ATP-binding protein PstB [Rodentibacter pneumotropicus]|uniref:Phosphate import ATP-binding protein PstB n=1 Tax=Rodentibacter pneumotropicus TaxID=758 RepID=A0A3S4W4Q2_9PAST|nr:phosphate import ATP-binding protein PstB [Rodentibacter pneumotropicus]
MKTKLSTQNLNFYYGHFHALKNINVDILEKKLLPLSGLPVVVSPHYYAYLTGCMIFIPICERKGNYY